MIVLILLIIAAVIFGMRAVYGGFHNRWEPSGLDLAFCLLTVALAMWKGGL